MAQMFLVRHAQASFGSDNYDKLSKLGHQQSTLLGEYFHGRKIIFDHVITGDMIRHKQTAQGIMGAAMSPSLNTDASWNEFDFETVVREYLALYPSQRPGPNSPRSQWYKMLKNAMLAWSANQLSNVGESWTQFHQRVNNAAANILLSPHKKVLVVTSGGTIATFLMALFNTTAEKAIGFNMQIKNTSVSEIFFNSSEFQLSSFNHVSHLDNLAHMSKVTYS